jgi:hypothetical protein
MFTAVQNCLGAAVVKLVMVVVVAVVIVLVVVLVLVVEGNLQFWREVMDAIRL